MATPNYNLPVAVTGADATPDDYNAVAETLDNTLHETLEDLLPKAVYNSGQDYSGSGWQITNAKTVTAGKGLIAGCWCETAAAIAITNLTNGATNYVYALANTDSSRDGGVVFQAQTLLQITVGRVYLGTITLNGAGAVTGVDNNASGVERNLYRLEVKQVTGSWTGTVAYGGWVVLEFDHSATQVFTMPMGIDADADPGVHVIPLANRNDAGRFRVRVENHYPGLPGHYVYGYPGGYEYGYGYGGVSTVRVNVRRWGLADD